MGLFHRSLWFIVFLWGSANLLLHTPEPVFYKFRIRTRFYGRSGMDKNIFSKMSVNSINIILKKHPLAATKSSKSPCPTSNHR
ncbi:hypothetical protein CIPAW_11G029300 [Carya illinoinensis]|uniref:Secreted protein n=1 Tax=Carya illinoinensis TaxID=32201 RepID=A0A8T1NYM5_CARIL|nr:hypothetical protein CIPAW_11G029300 [Carya illinoinensis]